MVNRIARAGAAFSVSIACVLAVAACEETGAPETGTRESPALTPHTSASAATVTTTGNAPQLSTLNIPQVPAPSSATSTTDVSSYCGMPGVTCSPTNPPPTSSTPITTEEQSAPAGG